MYDEYHDIVNVCECAEMLSVGKNKMYKILASGLIHCYREGNRWIIPKEAVIEYIKKRSKLI